MSRRSGGSLCANNGTNRSFIYLCSWPRVDSVQFMNIKGSRDGNSCGEKLKLVLTRASVNHDDVPLNDSIHTLVY